MKRPFGSGITRSLGDLRSPWLLTIYKSWDDPPSGRWPGYFGLNIADGTPNEDIPSTRCSQGQDSKEPLVHVRMALWVA